MMERRWLVLALLCVGVCVGALRPSVAEAQCTDNGDCPAGTNPLPPGQLSQSVITGTAGDDCIIPTGSAVVTQIDGGGGNDYICGRDTSVVNVIDGGDGNDTIYAQGSSGDTIFAGPGDDTVIGGDGNDNINGQDGADTIDGGGGVDNIDGGAGNDTINGGDGNDPIRGGDGDDIIFGDAGNDTIEGEAGNDTLNGGAGDDVLDGGTGENVVDGNGGTDTCRNFFSQVNCQNLNYALLHSFTAFEDQAGVVLRWLTVTEVSTIGFYVYREVEGSWVQVHEGLLPSLRGSAQGGIYDLRDPGASGEPARYLLVEVDAQGRRSSYGPYDVVVAAGVESLLSEGESFAREAHSNVGKVVAALVDEPENGERQHPGDAVAVYVGVEETGIYDLSSAELAARFGLSEAEVRERLAAGDFSLTEAGEPVAWMASPEGDALRFLGFAIDSVFTRERLYRVSLGEGLSIERVSRPVSDGPVAESFEDQIHFEEDVLPGTLAGTSGDSDFWVWAGAAPFEPAGAEVEFELESLVPSQQSQLSVELRGITDFPHDVDLYVNGVLVGGAKFNGMQTQIAELTLPAGLLQNGSNTLRIVAKGVDESIVYFDGFDLLVERLYETAAESLSFSQAADASLALRGAFGDAPSVFDVTDPRRPRLIEDASVSVEGDVATVSFDARADESYFTTAAVHRSPSALFNDVASELRSEDNAAEYLVIAPAPFYESARALVDYRKADGLQSMLVDLQDVYDEFSDGTANPNAVRAFLEHTQRWSQAPRYAVLVGKGSYDFRDLKGLGGTWFPPLLVRAEGGLFASDNAYADWQGDDGIPELAIGRLPVTRTEELARIVARIQHFEQNLDQLGDEVLMMADEDDLREDVYSPGHAFFARESDRIAVELADDWSFERSYRTEAGSLQEFRDALFEQLGRAPRFVHYLGHAGMNVLGGSEPLFHVDDVPDLELDGLSPVYLMMTCSSSRFELPGWVSLSEALLSDDDGAIAVWGASGVSDDGEAQALSTELLQILAEDELRLGDAVIRAQQTLLSNPDIAEPSANMQKIYQLFGDPALRFNELPPTDEDPDDGDPVDPGDIFSGCAVSWAAPSYGSLGLLLMAGLLIAWRRRSRLR